MDTNEQTTQDQNTATSSPTACTVNVNLFPTLLHHLLADLEQDGLSHIASFQPHGRAFRVHNPDAFVTCVLPKWFSQKNFASFQRQLNVYGFKRITVGPDQQSYYHEKFLRGQPLLANQIARTAVKGKGPRKAICTSSQPNFYIMPHLAPTELVPRLATMGLARQHDAGAQMLLLGQSIGAVHSIASSPLQPSVTSGSVVTQGAPSGQLDRMHLAWQLMNLGQNTAFVPSTGIIDFGLEGHFLGLSSIASPFLFGNGLTPHYTSFQALPAALATGCPTNWNVIQVAIVQEFIRRERARQIAAATTNS